MMTSPEQQPPSNGTAAAHHGYRNRTHLTVDVSSDETMLITAEQDGGRNDPKTPAGMRGHHDLRSPGVKKTPLNADARAGFHDEEPRVGGGDPESAEVRSAPVVDAAGTAAGADATPLPDFITQTDRHGNAAAPRTQHAGTVGGGEEGDGGPTSSILSPSPDPDDPCDTILDSFRMMCCCLMPEDGAALPGTTAAAPRGANIGARVGDSHKDGFADPSSNANNQSAGSDGTPSHPIGYSTRGHDAPLLLEEHSALRNGNDPNRIRLLPPLRADDTGKKCLVLDLDETLVHSSFRAVPGADFVIPVQIEDVVHFVYVAKRPGVDEFLLEMSRHYEIVVYTASLNKYADVLLDLLDPHRVVRTRLFRESCVFYEGNYVKDLSLLGRDLADCIIVDNSPASYLFHPENSIDCSSFIDDTTDRELDRINKFLVGLKDVEDVRGTVNLWRHWPNVDLTKNHRRIR